MTRPVRSVVFSNRIDFLELLPKNSVGAEFGCFKGEFAYWILEKVSPQRFFSVDPYWKAYGDKFPWKRQHPTLRVFEHAMWRMRQSANYQAATVVVEFDTIFLSGCSDAFFDWVYIDSTHEYEQTLQELELCKSKVKPNGLICGHDYGSRRRAHRGVTVAIHEWLDKNTDFELSLIDNCMQWLVCRKGTFSFPADMEKK
jgi:hypothetical protein